jgi:hypothetical protein
MEEAEMAITLYDITVPVFLRGFDRLEGLLDKGQAFAEAEGIGEAALVGARLAPDMLTLAGQVQRASDTAKFTAVRIGGVANLPFADEERSFAELRKRIARTRTFLEAVPRAALDGKGEVELSAAVGRGATPVTITGHDYALRFALPNFFFHVTTAYDILRHRGVPLSKRDYIGALD